MTPSALRRFTGIIGIAMYILVLVEIPFYFVYSPTPAGTPPVSIIFTRIFIDLFICIGLIGFFSGFRSFITQAAPDYEWLATFIFSSGLAFSIVAFVADSIQAGAVWTANGQPVNPTWVGHGADGALLIYGPINRLLNVVILFSSSILILKTRLFPKWLAVLGILIGIYNLAFIPTIFFMTTPLDFYSVNGWNIPIAAGWFFLWILILSIFILRKRNL